MEKPHSHVSSFLGANMPINFVATWKALPIHATSLPPGHTQTSKTLLAPAPAGRKVGGVGSGQGISTNP
jgi:hypothetical protein